MGKVYEPWPPGLDKADFGVKRFTRIGRRRRRSWISALMRIHDEDDGLFTAAINSGRERISPTRVSTHTHTRARVHHACTVTDAIRWDDYRFCSTRCLSCRYARAKSSKKTGFVLPFCRAVRPRHLFSIKLEHFVDWIPPWRRSNLRILWILPSGSLCIFLIRFIFLCVCIYIYIYSRFDWDSSLLAWNSWKRCSKFLPFRNFILFVWRRKRCFSEKVTNRFVAIYHFSTCFLREGIEIDVSLKLYPTRSIWNIFFQ